MKLSILIPTLEIRKEKYGRLVGGLLNNPRPEVCKFVEKSYYLLSNCKTYEILTERDNGELSVGVKRQKLLERATGDYICFIDDDDKVSHDYVEKVLKAIETKPDCCSLSGQLHWPNGDIERFEHSIEYDAWDKVDGIYVRYPNHLNAVRRELALQVGFKDLRHGEDRDYSDRLRPLLKTEEKIEGVIYNYYVS